MYVCTVIALEPLIGQKKWITPLDLVGFRNGS